MFWLCFYNGFDKPEIEAAFSAPFMVVDHVKHFIPDDRIEFYTVFYAHDLGCVSLKNFLENQKEF